MEEQIPLTERLKYMVGLRFDRVKIRRNGATVARGFYLFFGFYWFCFCFFKKWPLPFYDEYVTGFSLAYKPNSKPAYGDLLWLRDKKWLRGDRSGGSLNAA